METKTLKKSVGNLGEDYSSRYLESRGYTILGRNVYVDKKEIDIIAEKDGVISFVEVKTRTFSSRYSTAREMVALSSSHFSQRSVAVRGGEMYK